MTLRLLNETLTRIFSTENGKKKIKDYLVYAIFGDHGQDLRSEDGGKANNTNIKDRMTDCEKEERSKIQKDKCIAKTTGDDKEPCSLKCKGKPVEGTKGLKYNKEKNKCSIEFIGLDNPCKGSNISTKDGEYKREDEFRLSLKGDKTIPIVTAVIEEVIDTFSKSWYSELSKQFQNPKHGIKYGIYIDCDYNLIRPEAAEKKGVTYGTNGWIGLIISFSAGNNWNSNKTTKFNQKNEIKAQIVTIYPLRNNKPKFSDVNNSVTIEAK